LVEVSGFATQLTTIVWTMQSRGFKERIIASHGPNAPATYHRGQRPIDGIYTTSSITPTRCGYLAFGDTPGDQRCLWMDVPFLHDHCSRQNLYARTAKLKSEIIGSLTPAQEVEYNLIDDSRVIGMEYAEQKCRKIRMGGRKWSPTLEPRDAQFCSGN
jgi:hypothetical protein